MLGVITGDASSTMVRLLEHLQIPFQLVGKNATASDISQYRALAVLADAYPRVSPDRASLHDIVASFLDDAKPVFCEFLPVEGIFTEEITTKPYARLIARGTGSPVLDGIEPLSLLETHQNPFLVAEKNLPGSLVEHLSFGRVAGVDTAVHGLPAITHPGLVQHGTLIASSIKISDFDRMEYRLKVRFARLVMNICTFLCGTWHPFVVDQHANPCDNRRYMDPVKHLDDGARRRLYLDRLVTGLDWFEHAGMFPGGRGVGGVYEGFSSGFDPAGRKAYRVHDKLGYRVQRADCTADSALSFLLASLLPPEHTLTVEKQAVYKETSDNLFHELYTYWQHLDGCQSILRGFFGWANTPYDITVTYSDDNGRAVMEALLNAYIKKDTILFWRGFAGVNALHATVGKNGHRWARIDLKHFYQKRGRRWFRTHAVRRQRYNSPHYDGWTFAALLYGALLVNERSIIDLVGKGIADYMARFPDIPLEHSAGDDFSKLLVATVMLFQATREDAHLHHVHEIVDFFEPYQDPGSGAFPEIDPLGRHARTEVNNARYGTGESALYTGPGDTISDQLYSLGFLAIGLFLAWKTGRVPKARGMLTRLLDYLCMIQLASPNPQLHGAWTRGFDFRLGEPYGANGDVGWGAYCIETGWTMGPILTALGMYLLDLDPFVPLDPSLAGDVRAGYVDEKNVQAGIETAWKERTPRPVKHYLSMTPGEIEESLKGFKVNGLKTS